MASTNMNTEKIKQFWHKRALHSAKAAPSLVNLEEDSHLQKLKQQYERSLIASKIELNSDMNILDLGAGYGQWAFYFAPHVASVTAVEQSYAMIKLGIEEAQKLHIANVSFVHGDAELFQPLEAFDLVFISGLIMYLNDAQAGRLAQMAIEGTKAGGHIFLREMGSLLDEPYAFEDRWSEKLQSNYSAIYRTPAQFENLFTAGGQMRLLDCGDVYPADSPLNHHAETRLRYYLFEKTQARNKALA